MSRITGNEVQGLMEAYNAVYAPQELTEEQVWEEVENWVNSLIREGYDLSDYTWEDMYEVFINEDIKSFADRGGLFGPGGAYERMIKSFRRPQQSPKPTPSQAPNRDQQMLKNLGASQYSAFKGGGGFAALSKGKSLGGVVAQGRKNIGTFDSGPRNVGANRAAQIKGSPVVGPKQPERTTTSTRPASSSVSAPSKPKPSIPSAPPPPTSGPSAQNATVSAPEKTNILGNRASELAALQAKAKADTLAKKQTTQRPMSARGRMLNQDVDMFDLVKGHLMGEGYADTEEAAEAIMVSMSEEWRESILEQMAPPPVSAPPHPVDLPPPVSAPPTPPKTKKKNNEGKGEPMHPKGKEYPSAEKSIPGWNN